MKSTGKEKERKLEPNPTRKRKLNTEPPSYAKAARRQYRDDLCYAVIDSGKPTGTIPKDQHQIVEDLLNTRVMEHIMEAEGGPPIEIENSGFIGEILTLQLASQNCVETLKMIVDGISVPWEGGKLALVKKSNIPKLSKVTMFIKGWGSKFTSDAILKVIGKQNAGLAVEKWVVFHREEGQEGTLLVFGIDPESMASLVKTRGMVFFVTKAVYIKSGKVPIGMMTGTTRPETAKEEKAGENAVEKTPPTEEEGDEKISNSQEERLLEDK